MMELNVTEEGTAITGVANVVKQLPIVGQHIALNLGRKVVAYVQANADSTFKNPSGLLSSSFTVRATPTGAEAGSELPYSRRRDIGFSGRTDKRDRHYENDPGTQYFAAAVASIQGADSGFTAEMDALVGEA